MCVSSRQLSLENYAEPNHDENLRSNLKLKLIFKINFYMKIETYKSFNHISIFPNVKYTYRINILKINVRFRDFPPTWI